MPDPIRKQVLDKAATATLGDRARAYGTPTPNMTCAGKLKTIYQLYAGDKYSLAHDEAIELLLTKIGRIATGEKGHLDNYVDGAAYFAIAAECQSEIDALDKANADQYELPLEGKKVQDINAAEFKRVKPLPFPKKKV